jgi:Tol biopolymer transport system component
MGIRSRWPAASALLLLLGVLPISAQPQAVLAKVPAENGRIGYDRNSGEAVFTINPDGTDERQLLPTSTCCPRFSPDGRTISIPRGTEDGRIAIATVRTDGTGYNPLPLDDPTLNLGVSVWSPDGRTLAAEAWDEIHPDRGGIHLLSSADGSGLRRITTSGIPGDFSPDGSRIVFVTGEGSARGDQNAVFVGNVDGSNLRRVTPWGMGGCCTASWSPDGRWILFDARGDLFVVHPDGTGLRQIVLHPGSRHWAFEPGWSPDGSRIVFSMWVLALGQDDIYTARIDGSDLFQVTNTPEHEGQADWGAAVP